jgi:glycosyltransferase involved in cell wall biosynthesis
MPLVSVIIPTLNRPKLLLRAIDSVLCQTHQHFEIVVVVDSLDQSTIDAVESVGDPRVQIVVNSYSPTAAGARNAGADRSTGEWLAFLDDDDEWLPTKLQRQLEFVAGRPPALVTCLSRVVTPTAVAIRPKRIYDNSQPVDEYLFDRQSMFGGFGFMQTSSYLLPRSLFDKVRFDVTCPHDDWGFLLRLAHDTGARIETVPEVLAVLYFEEQRPSLTSRTSSWLKSLRWLDTIQPIITKRAYSGFCLGVVGSRAAGERAYEAFPKLLYRAVRHGCPRLWHVLPFLAYWLTPLGLRRSMRNSFGRSPQPSEIRSV